jgi:hypothetical protein
MVIFVLTSFPVSFWRCKSDELVMYTKETFFTRRFRGTLNCMVREVLDRYDNHPQSIVDMRAGALGSRLVLTTSRKCSSETALTQTIKGAPVVLSV